MDFFRIMMTASSSPEGNPESASVPLDATGPQQAAVLAIFRQHWENARHIKNERMSFTNIYAIVSGGVLSIVHGVQGQVVLEVSILLFLCFFSVIGLLTSLRLKAELEECLRNIEKTVSLLGLQQLMPVVDSRGALTRYPKFRWLFPVFYLISTTGFITLLIYRLLAVQGW
mgnify:CR=1 FL=1